MSGIVHVDPAMTIFAKVPSYPVYDAVSLDLETQGTDPGDVILSIGMVEFNSVTGDRGSMFYVTFDPEEWLKLGYTQRQSTLEWWEHPDRDQARATLSNNRCTVQEGLKQALEWLKERNMDGGLWSRGYMDETMLKLAIRKELGIEDPWHYRAAQDARTLLMVLERVDPNSVVGTPDFEGIPHNAFWDALHEAKLVYHALRYLNTTIDMVYRP